MKITPPKIIEVDNDVPFKNDVLNRKEFGTSLYNLITKCNDELVISLDSQWGEGKTTFIKMWQGLLDNNKVPNVYIDAFESDFLDDPFIAVASTILDYIKTNTQKQTSEKLTKLTKIMKKIGIHLLPLAAKLAILGIIKDSDIEALMSTNNEIASGVSSVVSGLVEERLVNHKKNIDDMHAFKTALSEAPKALMSSDNNPLVIIVDELDRCKPSYAIKMIENIKHLFSTKNIVFVLSMHQSQLEESVRAVYGQNIHASNYLQKFINVKFDLPKKRKVLYSMKRMWISIANT